MIVSHEHRFIFLKTRKTAGTSAEIALSSVCGDDDVLTPLFPLVDEETRYARSGRHAQNQEVPLLQYTPKDWARLVVKHRRREAYNHMPALEARRLVGRRVWNSYYKFAVSRNPFDVAVSMYHWRNQQGRCTMREFLQTDAIDRIAGNFDIYAIGGEVAVDRVLRYDRLADEFEQVRLALGLPDPLEFTRAKTTVRASAERRSEVFGPAETAVIAHRCAPEITAMSYTFEG